MVRHELVMFMSSHFICVSVCMNVFMCVGVHVCKPVLEKVHSSTKATGFDEA